MLVNAFQQRADARSKDFNAEEVDVRPRLRDCHRGFTHAAADFKDGRRVTVEGANKVDRSRSVRNPERRQQLIERAPLRLREAATAQREATDGCVRLIVRSHALGARLRLGVIRLRWSVQAALLGAMTPLVGELGLAL